MTTKTWSLRRVDTLKIGSLKNLRHVFIYLAGTFSNVRFWNESIVQVFCCFYIHNINSFHLTKLKEFANILPNNVRSAQKIIGNISDTFIKYASCPNCNSIYHLETCIIKQPDNTFKSRKCSFIPFPNHPHLFQRSHCDTVLMKNVPLPMELSVYIQGKYFVIKL